MRTAGLDVGSMTSKAVIMEDGKILGKSIISTSEEGEAQARHSLNDALAQAGIGEEALDAILVTGAGRKGISFAKKNKTTQSCIAKGAQEMYPKARLVVDVGAEHCILVKLDAHGKLEDSFSNDHCASGTGVFIETNESFPVGQELLMTFSFPDRDDSFKISGEISRTTPQGIGVKFKYQSQILKDVIEDFVAKMKEC